MSKFTLIIVIFLCSFSIVRAYDPIKGKPYHGAIHIANPLSAMSKFGGMAEVRIGLSSFNFGIQQYIGVYQGSQYRFEYQKYIRTPWRNEYYWYLRTLGGNALYDAKQLETFGDKSKGQAGPVDYYAGGAGFGRRFNFKHLFITMSAGLKYTMLPDNFRDENKELFRLFYVTGPGSIIDLNFRFGYQF